MLGSPGPRGGGARRGDRQLGTRCAAVLTMVPRAATLLGTGYLGAVTLAAWASVRAGKNRTLAAGGVTNRFAVLVAAHDEEKLIASTLESLNALDYPKDMLEVHVAADNCTDGTAMVARASGAEVHERHAPDDGGKGPALQWLLSRLLERDAAFDAVVVVDADTTVRPDVLRIVDERLVRGADVVQMYYAVAQADASAITGFRAAALAARHYLRPLGRNWFGGSSGLYGNGMVFRTDVLSQRAWTNHLTEDNELQLELLLAGTTVDFAPDAVIEAEMPTTIDASVSQHQRWERGRMEMVTRYELPLLQQGDQRWTGRTSGVYRCRSRSTRSAILRLGAGRFDLGRPRCRPRRRRAERAGSA